MRRVLLVQTDYNPWHVQVLLNYEPLALELLAESVRGIADVRIVDKRYERRRRSWSGASPIRAPAPLKQQLASGDQTLLLWTFMLQ